MDPWMKFFIVAMSLSVIVQLGILTAMYLNIRQTSERVTRIAEDFHRKSDPILARMHYIVEDAQPRISTALANAAEITELARGQAHKADRLMTEAIDRLRLQVIRADQILTGTMETLESTGEHLRRSVWEPVQRVTAVVRGIQAGLEFFRNRQRPAGPQRARAASEEELFI